MIGKTVVAVVVIVVIASAVGAFILISNSSGGSESVVSYYDGNEKIDEKRGISGSGIILPDRIASGERTLFGWSTLPDGSGKTYSPGSRFTIDGDARLYAMAVDGIITVAGSNAVFKTTDHADPVFIDLRYAKSVTTVTIDGDTMEVLKKYKPSLIIEYYNGLGLTLDPTAVNNSSDDRLSVGYSADKNGTTDIKIRSGGSDVSDLGGKVTVAMTKSSSSQSTTKVFLIGPDREKETSYSESSGRLKFDLDGFSSFRSVELYGVSAVRGSGSTPVNMQSDEIKIASVHSDYFQKYGMFAARDIFRLSPTADGAHVMVSGATRSADGDYVVSGNSPILIRITENTADGTFRIILPEEKKGFTLTSDSDSVPFGGRCVITYKLSKGYTDEELVISVNGNVIALNGLGEIHLSDISEDQYVTVEGVYDFRVYSITVPEKQVGYTLTTSVSQLHYGQSYTVSFSVDPGYTKGPQFSVQISNGPELNVSSGEATVNDVRGNHVIHVEGVEIINYNVTAGKNTVLRVNGQPASTATAFDLVTIEASLGYALPSTFEDLFPDAVKKVVGGYNVSGNTVFPSVVKITVGDNLTANGYSAGGSFIICTGDPVAVSAVSGYYLPDNYGSRLLGASGKSLSGGKYTFSEDIKLPSIFRVIYMGYDSELARYYVADGDNPPVPPSNPIRKAYSFEGWSVENTKISKNITIDALWSAVVYDVTFGKNLIYTINGDVYSVPGSYRLSIEDTILIITFPQYELPTDYFLYNSVLQSSDGYHITDNNRFESVYRIVYVSETYVFTFFLTDSNAHFIVDPVDQIDPPFVLTPPVGKNILDFDGWLESGTSSHYNGGQQIVVHKDYQFRAVWT